MRANVLAVLRALSFVLLALVLCGVIFEFAGYSALEMFESIADGAFLNGKYTVVGEVVQGMDVVDKLKRGEPPTDPDRIVHMQVAADAKQ